MTHAENRRGLPMAFDTVEIEPELNDGCDVRAQWKLTNVCDFLIDSAESKVATDIHQNPIAFAPTQFNNRMVFLKWFAFVAVARRPSLRFKETAQEG